MALRHRRMPLMALGAVSLLVALWAGLLRLGWPLPVVSPGGVLHHGPLMVTGFLGTMMGLERAVALGRRWPYAAPLLAGLAGLAWIAGASVHVGHALSAGAAAVLIAVFGVLYRQDPTISMATMGIGAVTWLVGTLLWHAGQPLYRVAPWWTAFLVLTVAAERLELSRFVSRGPWRRPAFVGAASLVLAGLLAGQASPELGVRLIGLGLLALSGWLLCHDIAWRTVRQPGLPRYVALCLLAGSVWLGIGGVLWLGLADRFTAGPAYDAMLHAVFLGFVFSMIFGHAPIILPSVLGISLPFRRGFYVHLGLLHVSLLARVAGDLGLPGLSPAWSGLANGLAIVLFLAATARAALPARAPAPAPARPGSRPAA